MTGVDLTPEYLRRARRDARRASVNVGFLCSDMREIDFDEEFDAAFNWFGSFGYFSDADNLVFCRKIFRALKPGGRFLVEGPNKSRMLAAFCHQLEYRIGGVQVAQRARWNARTNRLHANWTLRRGRRTEHHTVNLRLFNGSEMRRLLRAAGFRDVRLFSGEPGKPFTRHSRRVIAVGLKPRKWRAASRSAAAGLD
jgi:SAM-dependent methyltransferase